MAILTRWNGKYTRRRRLVQLAGLAVFVLLPLFDLFRFDFTAGRLHLFGAEIWLDEWSILWLALMFGMWLIGAMSLVFGRVYCAYACPQMVFTEIAHDFDDLARRLARPFDPKNRPRVIRSLSLAATAVVAVTASVFFLAYFAPLPDVVSRLLHFDLGLWVGAVGAATAIVAFLDFAFVREGFCRTACPYGLLQGVIEDGRSLHVRFDKLGVCIECRACVKACPMGIDIRDGAFQIECTRCGSCIDACDAMLGRVNRPGLLSFEMAGFSLRGFDLKRILVTVATVAFAVVLGVAVATREMVSIKLSPVYSDAASGSLDIAESRFLLRVANRGSEPVVLGVHPEGLPASAKISGLEDTTIPPGLERRLDVTVRVPAADTESSVTPFTWVVETPEGAKRFAASIFSRGRAS
ncbi:MAG TPA: 4Fe-4S dicluster domain-containing protein [Thermoanaerobaculia bacterium]|nr:4Fe-4S dicluster domain-containing protein [Thermoanaerobaculia bacterium]